MTASGSGTVHSATTVRNKPEDGGDYNVSLIDLAEGPRMMGRVVGVDPQAVRIGMTVSARIVKDGEKNIAVWEPTGAAATGPADAPQQAAATDSTIGGTGPRPARSPAADAASQGYPKARHTLRGAAAIVVRVSI